MAELFKSINFGVTPDNKSIDLLEVSDEEYLIQIDNRNFNVDKDIMYSIIDYLINDIDNPNLIISLDDIETGVSFEELTVNDDLILLTPQKYFEDNILTTLGMLSVKEPKINATIKIWNAETLEVFDFQVNISSLNKELLYI